MLNEIILCILQMVLARLEIEQLHYWAWWGQCLASRLESGADRGYCTLRHVRWGAWGEDGSPSAHEYTNISSLTIQEGELYHREVLKDCFNMLFLEWKCMTFIFLQLSQTKCDDIKWHQNIMFNVSLFERGRGQTLLHHCCTMLNVSRVMCQRWSSK